MHATCSAWYHNICYTCPSFCPGFGRWEYFLQHARPASSGACVANIVIPLCVLPASRHQPLQTVDAELQSFARRTQGLTAESALHHICFLMSPAIFPAQHHNEQCLCLHAQQTSALQTRNIGLYAEEALLHTLPAQDIWTLLHPLAHS